MRSLYLLSTFFHILAVIIWMGGMFFLGLVVIPILREHGDRSLFSKLVRLAGVRFRLIGWICLLMLVVTGLFQLLYRGYGWADFTSAVFWQSSFGGILSVKLGVVAVILSLSVVHDFYIGPRATVLMNEDPGSVKTESMRRAASWIGRINLLLGLLVVFLALMLIRGAP